MKANKNQLIEYYNFLKKQRDQLMNNAIRIRDVFAGFEWDDRIYEGLKTVLNVHIKTVNCLLTAIDGILKHIDNYIDLVTRYENLTDT